MIQFKKEKELPIFTPTKWQSFILKNYGLVDVFTLSQVLGCDRRTVIREAKRLGLEKVYLDNAWVEKSYLTIIENNWDFLSYRQIKQLFKWDDNRWLYELENNDYIKLKLGDYKPDIEDIKYSPLTKEQEKETKKIRRIIEKNVIENYASPHSFEYPILNAKKTGGEMLIYPYDLVCNDALMSDDDIVSDEALKSYQSAGITALWFQPQLIDLSPCPFSNKNNDNYLKRRAKLNDFIEKSAKYGIKIYIYLNEPKGLNVNDWKDEYKYLMGRREGDIAAMCFSQQEVKDYLYTAIYDLLKAVPKLGGIFTITSSEGLTHCKHKMYSDCPKCKDIPPYVMAAEINNTIYKAVRDSGASTRVVASLWGWMPYCDISTEDALKGIALMDKNIDIMCVSEFGTHKNGNVGEYSISHGEPCFETIKFLKHARKLGHKVWAKIQVNNCWEMSSVPTLPCFELIINHLTKLKKLGVNDIMLSWTLGGFPSFNISLTNSVLSKDFDYNLWLKEEFKDNAIYIKMVSHLLSEGFKKFPFSLHLLYFSPLSLGSANMIYSEPTGKKATIVTFPYDDVDTWLNGLNRDDFELKMNILLRKFKKAMKLANSLEGNEKVEQVKRYTNVWYITYKSLMNQYYFYKNRNDLEKTKNIINDEIKLTKELYRYASLDSTIGFEPSNQYIYTPNMFLEKLVALYKIKGK